MFMWPVVGYGYFVESPIVSINFSYSVMLQFLESYVPRFVIDGCKNHTRIKVLWPKPYLSSSGVKSALDQTSWQKFKV